MVKVFNICKEKINYILYSYNGFQIEGDTIIKYEGSGNIVIPSVIEGIVITKIGDYAFAGDDIDNVVIPDTIEEIGNYAFAKNNIKAIKIPNSVKKIGEGAFIHNSIKSISISQNTIVGNACFNDNQLDDENAFFYKINANGIIDYSEIISYGGKMRSNVKIPEIKENTPLVTIGEKCFWDDDLVSVTIPDTVTSIQKEAFKDNYLVEVYLSDSINDVAINAFSNNNYLTQIIIDNTNSSILNYPWGADGVNLYWLK